MCKYEEIEDWRLSNGKTIRKIKTRKAHQDPQSPGELFSFHILYSSFFTSKY